MKKNYVIFALVLTGIVGVLFVNTSRRAEQEARMIQSKSEAPKSIAVKQKVGDTAPVGHQVNAGFTALDLLTSTTKTDTTGEGKDAFVINIDGRAADRSKKEFWTFSVNGRPAEVGAGSYLLQNNDSVVWQIATY